MTRRLTLFSKRFAPTAPQIRHIEACQRGDSTEAATSATATACRCAGWTTRGGEITAMGRDVLARMMEAV